MTQFVSKNISRKINMKRCSEIFKIADYTIGGGRTFIIAEIGSNYNQSLELAFESIDAAIASGADAVKFQSLNIKELYYSPNRSIIDLHKKIDLKEQSHFELKSYCDKRGIIFFSAPTYLKAIELLEKINVQVYKLASAQIGTFPQLVSRVAQLGKPTFLSTGLVTIGELEKTINIFKKNQNINFAILHCNSIYPTPYAKVNLKMIPVYRSIFQVPVGFSDHTTETHAAIAAVTMGASIIEKHFTLSKTLPVPDAEFSLEPENFHKMVLQIRDIEQALGTGLRLDIEQDEQKFKDKILYRLVLMSKKYAGDSFSEHDFEFKRHSYGIDCNELSKICQFMKAKNDLSAGTLLNWDLIEGKHE